LKSPCHCKFKGQTDEPHRDHGVCSVFCMGQLRPICVHSNQMGAASG
jgi:hypothetical protein